MQLPLQNGTTWSFTGGPHGGWDAGSAWAALDCATLAALQDSLAGFRSATKVMQASFAMHGEQGGLVVLADEQRHVWRVVVHGPAAPDGEDYLICFITPDGLKHAITVGRGGAPSVHTLEMPKDGTPVLGAALLMEPRTAPPDKPEIPIAEVRL